uniref:Uncharacterized protein n=1 Tax=Calcidiscus leptoporus TaxID=127549 RepID=A0A7S0JCL4_9EUKA|mmetsp:Transcript_50335/g.116192  ORF Transcript_50335/g.116192 Transcript_50335/m.116192 type:complete len:146 (+) Transcript_50335:46-483(+)
MDRSRCALKERVGDDLKTASYTCAGCAMVVTGYGPWRNHMKRSKKHKLHAAACRNTAQTAKTCDDLDSPTANAGQPRELPQSSVANADRSAPKRARALAERANGAVGSGSLAKSDRGLPKEKKKRVRGPANEARRLAYAAKRVAP